MLLPEEPAVHVAQPLNKRVQHGIDGLKAADFIQDLVSHASFARRRIVYNMINVRIQAYKRPLLTLHFTFLFSHLNLWLFRLLSCIFFLFLFIGVDLLLLC